MVNGQYLATVIETFAETAGRKDVEALCREIGVPTAPDILQEYSAVLFTHLIEEGGRRFWPEKFVSKVYRYVGEKAFSTFAKSLTGKVGLTLSGKNVKKLASQTPRYFLATNSAGKVTFVDTGEKTYRLEFRNFEIPPHYYYGLVEVGTHALSQRARVKMNILRNDRPEPYVYSTDVDFLIEIS